MVNVDKGNSDTRIEVSSKPFPGLNVLEVTLSGFCLTVLDFLEPWSTFELSEFRSLTLMS